MPAIHISHMQTALMLARRGQGICAPNPSVGCVIVKNGRVVGRGNTAPGGRPHAETQALEMAGADAKGADVYVTLEPCSHYGKTPPCAEALIKASVKRVIVACIDPNPQVNGKGLQMLKDAGIEVIVGVEEAEALALNKGFFKRMAHNGCEVNVKIATTQNGSFTVPGQRWITGEASRRFVHLMRAQHDAIITGIGTVLADDPELTCRIEGLEQRSPKAFVLDSHLRFPENAKLAHAGTTVFTTETALKNTNKIRVLKNKGVEVLPLVAQGNRISLPAAINSIGALGYNRLMVEAGPGVSEAFLTSGLADMLYWFTAPQGAEKSNIKSGFTTIKAGWKELDQRRFGADILRIYNLTA